MLGLDHRRKRKQMRKHNTSDMVQMVLHISDSLHPSANHQQEEKNTYRQFIMHVHFSCFADFRQATAANDAASSNITRGSSTLPATLNKRLPHYV